MNIDPIFAGLKGVKTASDLAKAVAHYLEMTDSLDAKIGRLIRSELGSAMRSLRQAADSETQRESLLCEARNHFNKAIELEQGYRKGVALLGLSLTHHHLGDKSNAEKACKEILEMPPAIGWWEMVMSLLHEPYIIRQPGLTQAEHYKAILMETIGRNEEAMKLHQLQEAVRQIQMEPVKWEDDVEKLIQKETSSEVDPPPDGSTLKQV